MNDAEEGTAGSKGGEGHGEGEPPGAFKRLADLNRPEWKWGALGVLCACIAGLQVGWGGVG